MGYRLAQPNHRANSSSIFRESVRNPHVCDGSLRVSEEQDARAASLGRPICPGISKGKLDHTLALSVKGLTRYSPMHTSKTEMAI